MNLIIIPILAGIFSGVTELLYKAVQNKKFSKATYIFTFYLIATIITLPFFIFKFEPDITISLGFIILLALACYVLGNYFMFSALKVEDLSNIAIVRRSDMLFSVLFGFLFFNELITNKNILGVVLIILGVLVIFFEKKKISMISYKGLLFSLLTGFFFALAAFFAKYILKSINPYFFVFLIYLGLTISFSFFPKVKTEYKELFKLHKAKILAAGILGVFAYLLNIISLKVLNLSISFPVIGSTALSIAVLSGLIILKERKNLFKKLVGLIFVIAGIYMFA